MKSFLLFMLTISYSLCFGQDTLFFDSMWKPTTKMNAEFFRIEKKEGNKWVRMDYFYKTNQLQMKGTYTSLTPEIKDGYFEWYHANGKISQQSNFENGKHIGEYLLYHENGNLEAKGSYQNDELNGTFESYYPNGKLVMKTSFLDGLQNGWTVYHREDGSKHSEGNFKNGNRNGEWKYYDENGNIKGTTVFKIDYEIEEANMSLQLPNNEWFLANYSDKGFTQYTFKRNEITDLHGRIIVPAIMLYIEDAVNYEQDIIVYSLQKRLALSKMNIQLTDKILIPDEKEFPFSSFENAILLTGTYSDNGFDHIIYMLYIINEEDKGIQLYMDMTKDIADKYEKEFWTTLQSIKKLK